MSNKPQYEVLYEGSNHNGLGDHRYQQIIKVTDEMGLSILGPVKRADYLHGLPNVEEDYCNVVASNFTVIPGSPFKVAAIQFINPKEHPGMEDYHGLYFRPVGYIDAGDAYDSNWSVQEIAEFIRRIRELGNSGIRKDKYLEDQWKRQVALAELRHAYSNGEVAFEVGENIPQHFGNPSIDTPVEFMFCNAYIPDWCNDNKAEWEGMVPIGAKLKKIKVFKKELGGNLWIRTEIQFKGETLFAESSQSIKSLKNFQIVGKKGLTR